MFLIFDTETTGLPRNYNAPLTDFDNWPRLVQIAWQLHDLEGKLVEQKEFIVKPDGFTIPFKAEEVHGISTQLAIESGVPIKDVFDEFQKAVGRSTYIAGHNVDFDLKITGSELLRNGFENSLQGKTMVDTMIESTNFCALPGGRGGKFKYPKLGELHEKLFGESFEEAHNATADVVATSRCLLELIRVNVIGADKLKLGQDLIQNFRAKNPGTIQPIDIKIKSLKKASERLAQKERDKEAAERIQSDETVVDTPFCHLHVHSYFSVLQAAPSIPGLIKKAKAYNMPAIALTDLGNIFGAYAFIKEAVKNKIKPIVGCEFYLVKDRTKQKFTNDNPDRRYQQVMLAKNYKGYKNLSKLSSIGWIEGNYAQYPRIDREVLEKNTEGLIATTGGMQSEICDLILNVGEQQAEEAFKWWHELFGDDFYIQLNRHNLEEERRVNAVLLEYAKKYGVKVFAANNVFHIEKEDEILLDSLLCIKNNEYLSTEKGRGRGKRFGFPNKEFYLKSQEEMKAIFEDIPEAISNSWEIVNKIETYSLDRKPLMPYFPIPEGFSDPDEYLRHLTYEGAKERYTEITKEITERIDFELSVIKNMGYPGYFLIVWDFLAEARKMGVWVGPGRGSAAGSVAAYCLKITDVDPIHYGLLFERFLNPDRVSLPDIDIDFDEDGRDRILKWVVNKYGEQRVAHIITFGKMAPKMALRDIARVKQLPLTEANRLAKLIPTTPGTSFKDAFKAVPDLVKEKKSSNPLVADTIQMAERIEGTVRNIGTHACGIIIGKDDLIEHIPLSTSKDADLLVTQYDGAYIENVGMLKMDFLGLKTLSIIKDAVDIIKKSKGDVIDIDDIPFDDTETFELFSRGDTTGVFQFESDGMKKNLKELKPNRFEDLIAMNALYRPGPMEYIPNFIRRKHGTEKIEYDIPEMEEILQETYGITVYQEQVMQLSQLLAKFTRGQADTLRKAMGKKQIDTLNKLKPIYLEGAEKQGHDAIKLEKIWNDWKEFAKYAFNKSHSTCYAYVAYRMAWLKAHYPAEFISAVLSRNLNDITKITFFIDEAKHMGINVLKPDVNESELNFIVNKKGEVRFGMAAIKGLGSSAVEAIIEERNENGPYTSMFDFARRTNLRVVNKRSFEALAKAGAFDSFENTHRAQFFYRENSDDSIFMEKVMKFAAKYQERQNSQQVSLFGDDDVVDSSDPPMPDCKPWSKIEQLKMEKEVTGFYISGHPLDEYKLEMQHFGKQKISDFKDNLHAFKNRQIVFGGMVTGAEDKMTKTNKPFGSFTVEDFDDSIELRLFSEDYLKHKHFLSEGFFLLIFASVQQRFYSEDQVELKISNIMLLPEVLERETKEIRLKMTLNVLSDKLITELLGQAQKSAGNCRLNFQVYDAENKLSISMNSTNMKVKPQEFLKALDRYPEIEYKLG